MVGSQKIIVRDCSEGSELLELNLYINVLRDDYLQTDFDVELG